MIKRLCIMLQKWEDMQKKIIKLIMSFLIEDDKSLQKYNKIWDKTGAILLETNLILNQDTIKNTQKLK